MMTGEQRRLAERYVRLAKAYAAKASKRYGEDYDECLSDALYALCKATTRYDPSRAEFSTFAHRYMEGEVLRGMRDRDRRPRDARADGAKLEACRNRLWQQLGREPNVAQMAQHLGWNASRVEDCAIMAANRFPLSLDARMGADDGAPVLHEVVSNPAGESQLEAVLVRLSADGIPDAKARRAVELCRIDGLSSRRAGNIMRQSPTQVRRLVERGLDWLEAA